MRDNSGERRQCLSCLGIPSLAHCKALMLSFIFVLLHQQEPDTRYNSQLSFHGFHWVSLTHELTSPTNYETVFILYIPIHVYEQVNPQNYIPWTLFIIDHFLKKNWSSRIKMIAQQLVIDCKGGVEFLRKFGTSVESQIIYAFYGFVQHPS